MQLTKYTDYALRVLIYMAKMPEKRVTIDELADYFEVSRHHLVKVVHNLGKKGFVRSVRGKSGGLYLSRPAAEISIGHVVREMEGHFHTVECLNANKQCHCKLFPGCGLIGLLSTATENFLATLDKKVLSDVTRMG